MRLMNLKNILPILLVLALSAALSLDPNEVHEFSTMAPLHEGSLPVLQTTYYSSSGNVTVTYKSKERVRPSYNIVYYTRTFTCTHAKECGSSPNLPCCPCSIPVNVSFIHGIPLVLQTAMNCVQNHVSACLYCRRACGDLNRIPFVPYSDPTVCQSSQCTSSIWAKREDCGIA